MSFDWSIGPLVSLMKAVGLPLDSKNVEKGAIKWFSKIKVFVVHGIALFAFLINVETKLYYLGLDFLSILKENNPQGTHSSTSLWNVVISKVNYTFGACGTHLGLLGWTLVHWQSFIQVLHHIERELKLSPSDYRKIRTISLIGVAFLVLMYFSICYISILPTLQWSTSWWQILICFITEVGNIHYFNAVTLFLCLSWMLVRILKIFGQRIEYHCDKNQSISVLKGKVSDWKRHYLLINQLVDQLNNCFCVILLVIFTVAFIRSVNFCFTLTNSFGLRKGWTVGWNGDEASLGMVYFLLIELFLIVQVAYVSHLIGALANDLAKHLRSLPTMNNFALRSQTDSLVIEMLNCPLKITGCGLFNIDLHLIPTFLGSALTYLIILYQFKSSENSL